MRATQEIVPYFHAAQKNALVTLVISRNIFACKQSSNWKAKSLIHSNRYQQDPNF